MKRIIILILCLFIITGASACGDGVKTSSQTAMGTPTPVPTQAITLGPRPTESNPVGSTIQIGDIFAFDEWDCSVVSYEFVKQYSDANGTVLNTAPEGMIFLTIKLQLTNNGAADGSFMANLAVMEQKVFKVNYNMTQYVMTYTFQPDDLFTKKFKPYSSGSGYVMFSIPEEVQIDGRTIYLTGGTSNKIITVKIR